MKLLILGGYGVFGARLAQLLADVPGLTLLIAGRSADKARQFCKGWVGAAQVRPIALDRKDIAQALAQERPDIIIDASGPFQAYGDAPYGVVEAAIAQGVHYLDFADGSDFVFGIKQFDAAAQAAGVVVLSGVSSFPVLTYAVLAEAAKTMQIERARGGIAPSPHAIVGMNVMRAVLAYAGRPVSLRRRGALAKGVGLVETLRYTIAVPGRLPLHNKRFSLVDVPDLQVIPPHMPHLAEIWMGAAPEPEILHRMLSFLAKLRHKFRLPPLNRLAPLCYHVLNACRFGEHRGGMFIEMQGMAAGKAVTRSWHLLAEGEDGPFIPSMAIEGVVRHMLAGKMPKPGARAAIGALTLADYDDLFAGRQITGGWREDSLQGPAYLQLLGPSFEDLPPMVQALHRPGAKSQWQGRAQILAANRALPRLLSWCFGFPKAAQDVPVTVTFTTDPNGVETWERNFDGKIMRSTQERGTGRDAHLLVECFGPFRFGLGLEVKAGRLTLTSRRWSFLGLPLPRALIPGGHSFEREEDGRFRFHVEIAVPLLGPIVTYDGWLLPLSA